MLLCQLHYFVVVNSYQGGERQLQVGMWWVMQAHTSGCSQNEAGSCVVCPDVVLQVLAIDPPAGEEGCDTHTHTHHSGQTELT